VAEYFTGIHLLTPFSYFCVLKGCQWIPFFVNPFLHTLMWGYRACEGGNQNEEMPIITGNTVVLALYLGHSCPECQC
jgi:hypothetical protein